MNKDDVLALNVIPEGRPPWLNYEAYMELKRLFEVLPLPSSQETSDNPNPCYLTLHHFLTKKAGLTLPFNEATIHFNAFALIRRGYQVESITSQEYSTLCRLMQDLVEPDIDDLDLYESGGHRVLYDYLTKGLGLPVEKGRGPAWHRAKDLLRRYETEDSKG